VPRSQPRSDESRDVAEWARLAHLEALTDSTLTRLDVDELLAELLARVREILDGDTSAVLMLDAQSGFLVARAACGIEEEVHQGVRVPIGTGFAGKIAATKQPVRLDRVDSTTVSNPILWDKGLKRMVGVPLLSGDTVIGVLHVGRLEDRSFTDHDVELLQIVSDRIVSAIQVRQFAIERAATVLLERSLLPMKTPTCPGLSFATRYVAAEGNAVGGDWYDLFTLPSGRLWIVVGDVAGHGVQAAIVMGRIRSALRAYTLLDVPVERAIDLVDTKVSHFEIDTMATLACAVLDPPYESMTVAVAGHPPPVLAVPGQPTELIRVEPSPPIGTRLGAGRRATTVDLPPDAVVAIYTDGLVERRRETIDVGLGRLLRATTPGPPELVAAQIMRQVIAGTVPTDDIALVVMRRAGKGKARSSPLS
jgi:sigma-B regulation protein RsbU (phosphoserine phosphatase)